MAELPSGTVTFLFTDLESSTRLWEDLPEAMSDALARHDEILRDAVDAHEGVVLSRMGDGIAAVFTSAPHAVMAALEVQRFMAAEPWAETGPLRARMGLHTDEGRMRAPGEYMNQPLNRSAGILACGLLRHPAASPSSKLATKPLVRSADAPSAGLRPCLPHQIAPIRAYEHLWAP